MPALLLEILSEEIPARMQANAARALERMARERLAEAGLLPAGVVAYAGPRRLTLAAEGLAPAQADRTEEVKGPKVGAPEQALEGFLRKTGLKREQLVERDGVWFAVSRRQGRRTAEIIAEMVPEIVRAFPWPKSMRWGTGTLRWVRPIRRILCTFDGEVVPFEIDGIVSGDLIEGHRFMGSGAPVRARTFDDYAEALRREFVVLDPEERKARILEGARTLCFARNLELIEDAGLLEEVAGLAEWPVPLLGDMDPAFLDLPPEVIRTSMRTHQKYFAVRRAGESGAPPQSSAAAADSSPASGGALAPHFLAVSNIEASDGGAAIAQGNARVLSARLNDARFFWDEDRKSGFGPWLKKLEGVTFHAKLGTMAERVARIEALAREIAPLVGADPELAGRAARLCKADLASAMVGEFPELQGVMGGYYAAHGTDGPASPLSPWKGERPGEGVAASPRHDGDTKTAPAAAAPIPDPSPFQGEGSVAAAIRDHYKPQGPNDAVPTAPVTVAVALADKLDTLVGFFAIDEKPTGSKDPYALRRAALGVIRIVLEGRWRINIPHLVHWQLNQPSGRRLFVSPEESHFKEATVVNDVTSFLVERLQVLLRDRGKRHDLVQAIFWLSDYDLVRIVARVEALDAFLGAEDGANLLAGYKRAVNILRAEAKKGDVPEGTPDPAGFVEAEEQALHAALERVRPAVADHLQAERFSAAMAELAALRGPVDAFFERVLVNAPDEAVRANRLRLLGQVREVMGQVADFGLVTG